MITWKRNLILILTIFAILVIQTNFVVAEVTCTFDLSDTDIKTGDAIDIDIEINSINESIESLEIDFDNGDIVPQSGYNLYVYDESFTSVSYDEDGSFNIDIDIVTSNGTHSCSSETIDVEILEIPDDDPTLSLLSPTANKLLKADAVDFRFTANDDFALSTCTFELYKDDGSFDELEYESDITNPGLGSEMIVKLKEFDDGNYTWYVTCNDNNSQSVTKTRKFSIQTTSHERQKEIEQLLIDIENFMKKEDSLNLEEKDAISELGISDDLRYYKKRLMQIDQDLGSNIKFISDVILREKRKIETIEELDEIIKKIPTDIEIMNGDEYIKNSLTSSIDKTIEEYTIEKQIMLTARKIKKLAKFNTEIQSNIVTSTDIKKILVSYKDEDKEITIIKKELKISDSSFKKILEIFPDGFNEEIIFITKAGKVTDNIYEINLDDLDSNEIIYYIESDVNLNKIKDTETIIFEEFVVSNSIMTGFSIFNSSGTGSSSYIIIAIIIFVASGFIFTKKSKHIINKDNVSHKMNSLIGKTKNRLKENDFDIAKENYHKIKSLYPHETNDSKAIIFDHIEKIRVSLDKEEMKNLIGEYEKSKKEKDIENSKMIYERIKTKYTHLPKKEQTKVYNWITSNF